MTKTEMINEIAERHIITKKKAAEIVDGVFELIEEKLTKGERVIVSGFGQFNVKTRKARNGYNPKTGNTMKIEKQKTPTFKAGDKLKRKVKQNK